MHLAIRRAGSRPQRRSLPPMPFLPVGFLALLLAAAFARAAVAAEPVYDLVFRGARIVDGTGNPWFNGDVAVKGQRIAAVGRVTGAGTREVDTHGLALAPGFIDMHSHSD